MNLSMSSDDEMWLTQNTFSQESGLPDLDYLSEILGTNFIESTSETFASESPEDNLVPTKPSTRKITLVGDEELEKRKESRIPENTKKNTTWAVSVWRDWAESRNMTVKESESSTEKLVNVDVLKHSNDKLNYWLAKLVVEVRRKDKNETEHYRPNTLYQLCCGLLRHLRENGRPAINIFEDPCFKHFQDSLDSEMKRLTSLGVDAEVKQAKAFSEEDENKLWELHLLGDQSAKALSRTMVFLIGKNFALRSGKEHRDLKFSQFTLEPAIGKEPEKLIYVSFGEKNNLGGLKHRQVKRKRIEHYSNEDCPERCLVRLYKCYVKKCPREAIMKDVFYVAPRKKYSASDETWFTSNSVGYNTLGDTVKNLCKEAGIEGFYTNHSLRATTATRGLAKGIPEKFVMERTGHRDVRSLQRYQRPSIPEKIEISRAFEGKASLQRAESKDLDSQPTKKIKLVSDCGMGGISGAAGQVSFQNCTFNIGKDFNIH